MISYLQGCDFHRTKYLRKLRLKEIMWLFQVPTVGHQEHVVLVNSLDLKHLDARDCASFTWVSLVLT